jgi:hypothetical protein
VEIRHAPSRRVDLNKRFFGSVPNDAIRLLIFRLTVESAPLNPKNSTPKTGKLDAGFGPQVFGVVFRPISQNLWNS